MDAAELEALCNVSVLRFHQALTKERYRHYTGAKNLNALNRIINAGWCKYDHISGTISLHQTIIELIESDIKRTPKLLPGLFQHIQGAFDSLEYVEKFEDAKQVTFALLMLTEFDLTDNEEKSLYLKLADFISRFYQGNIPQLYDLLFEEPDESTWYMDAEAVMNDCIEVALSMDPALTPFMLSLMVARYAFTIREGKQDSFKIFGVPQLNGSLEDSATALGWIEEFLPLLNVYASIMADPRIKPDGSVSDNHQKSSGWGLSLADHPFAYDYFRHVLNATVTILNLAKDHELDGYTHLFELANKLIIQVEESLGRFSFYNLDHKRILEYVSPTEEEYVLQTEHFSKTHNAKKAAAWYSTLVQTIDEAVDPFPIYKLILNAEYALSRTQAAILVKNNFTSKLLLDSRLTGEQKRYLSVEFCAEQIDALRNLHFLPPKRVKELGKTHKNVLTMYAQLLSGAELLLENISGVENIQMRLDIYRAAFILKQTIGVEILDPKPYINADICSQNIVFYLPDFLEMVEWTRADGYIKNSQQMEKALMDSCLGLDFDYLPEDALQLVIYHLEPLAKNYKRQDVLDVLWQLKSPRRSFCVDLLESWGRAFSETWSIIHDLSEKILTEICRQYYEKTIHNVIPTPSSEYASHLSVFLEINKFIDQLCPENIPPIWELCSQVCIPDNDTLRRRSWKFAHNCHDALRCLVFSPDRWTSTDVDNKIIIEGLLYLFATEADGEVLEAALPGFMETIANAKWRTKRFRTKIVKNIHRLRPEMEEFLTIE